MNYTFQRHHEAAMGDGFGYPIDVFYRTIYLGTLVANPDGFVIELIDTPRGKKKPLKTHSNFFRTESLAAIALHRTWLYYKQHVQG